MSNSSINVLKISNKDESGDEYYTPNIAIVPLLEYLPKDKVIYEAASNRSSQIVDYLRSQGYHVMASDDRDFLEDELPEFDIIVTNPPYSKKDKFIERCYSLDKPFALLLPVSTIQGNKRGQLFMNNGLELLVLNQRVNFIDNNNNEPVVKKSPHFGVAWFCYNLLPEKLIFKNIR